MKCVVPGVNIKVFGRAIHSLSKIGEELYVEPLEHGLALRTVNSSRSAYACFLFSPSFFQLYDDGIPELSSQDSDDENLRCKVGMKSCLTVFKSMSTIEKTVERCKVTMDMREARLIFQLYCKHGIVKTHNLAFIECETLQAVFSKDMCVNKLTAPARLLSEAVVNFQNNQEEITLIASPEKISLKNYVDDEPDPNKVMHTVLNLDPNEFDSCQFGVDTEITFCLKELRAILTFADITGMPLSIQFETPGRPVVFCIDTDPAFEANFVLATLADSQSTQVSSSQQPQTSTSTENNKSRKRINDSSSRTQNSTNNGIPRKKGISERNNGMADHSTKARPSRSERLETAYEDMMDDDFDDEMIINDVTCVTMETNKRSDNSRVVGNDSDSRQMDRDSPKPSTSTDGLESPVIPNLINQNKRIPDISVNEDLNYDDEEEEENEDETIPGTPPTKKFRSLLFGTSQTSTQQTQATQQTSMVLAEDTDEDD